MTPKHYLDSRKEDILSNLTGLYTEAEANDILKDLYFFVGKLKTVRRSETLTDEALRLLEGYPDLDRRSIKHWLLKAIQYDDSYVYAYTPLSQESNCRSIGKGYQVKDIAYNELIRLIESEDNEQVATPKDTGEKYTPVTNPEEKGELTDGSQDNPLVYDHKILIKFYSELNGILWNTTDLESFKNWFRVAPNGKPDFKKDKKTYFCYAVKKIEKHIIKDYKPKNFGNWIKPTIDGNSYSKLIGQAIEGQRNIIDEKLDKFI